MVKGDGEHVSDWEWSSEDNDHHNDATLTLDYLFVCLFSCFLEHRQASWGPCIFFASKEPDIIAVSWSQILDSDGGNCDFSSVI